MALAFKLGGDARDSAVEDAELKLFKPTAAEHVDLGVHVEAEWARTEYQFRKMMNMTSQLNVSNIKQNWQLFLIALILVIVGLTNDKVLQILSHL